MSTAFTISPKTNDFDNWIAGLKEKLNKMGEWCLVLETSDSGHKHLHGGVLSERSVSSVSQTISRYWSKLDPDYCAKTVLCKTWYKPQEEDILDGMYDDAHRATSWMNYIYKTKVPVEYSDNFPVEESLMDHLADNVPLAERRANIKFKLLKNLSSLCEAHGIQLPLTVRDCRVAMNKLAWVHEAWEIPLDSRKATQIAVGWWKLNTRYSGDSLGDPDAQKFTCDSCGKRKHVQQREYVRDDLINLYNRCVPAEKKICK